MEENRIGSQEFKRPCCSQLRICCESLEDVIDQTNLKMFLSHHLSTEINDKIYNTICFHLRIFLVHVST